MGGACFFCFDAGTDYKTERAEEQKGKGASGAACERAHPFRNRRSPHLCGAVAGGGVVCVWPTVRLVCQLLKASHAQGHALLFWAPFRAREVPLLEKPEITIVHRPPS